MIDRESRDRLATATRRFAAGLISKDDLDDIDVDWRDRGAVAVKQMSWNLYSDTKQYYAQDEHRLTGETRQQIARWIIFLHSDNEYLWPEYSFMQCEDWFMNLLTFGWWGKQQKLKWNEFLEAGDFSVWPYRSEEEFKEAISHPRFFRGTGD